MRQLTLGCSPAPSLSFRLFTLLGVVLLGAVPATALTLTVTSTNDSGPGSLRQAITTANSTPAADTIAFGISTGQRVIVPQSTLPTITAPLIIDGSTQPGFAGKPLIVLDGRQTGGTATGVNGLTIEAANCRVKALVISGFGGSGIFINGATATATGNVISGCYIGTNAAGSGALPNSGSGITIFIAKNNLIGGVTASERNILSGNSNGININGFDRGADDNKVQGNYIGTNAAGTAALPNGNAGIFVEAGAKNNLIGGTTATARNVISGNGGTGIVFFDAGTNGNKVQGNYIGTNAAGSAALPNHADGVSVLIRSGTSGPKNTVIGGLSSAPGTAPGNVISSNDSNEVTLSGAGTDNTVIQGNLIGTNASGTAALKAVGNTSSGVRISNGARGTTVGGTMAKARNVISGNGGGVVIEGTGPTDNLTVSHLVQGNYIGTNISGNAAIGNSVGVQILAAKNNTIGGATTILGQSPGNVIAGNRDFQVRILIDGASNNTVQGNLIGTNKDGNAVLGAADTGVRLDIGAKGNFIGGATANLRNVISGNNTGVIMVDAGTESNVVRGNFIGTNLSGSSALANREAGVTIFEGASRNTVNNNVVSGNGVGIALHSGATANQIQGNNVGTDAAGLKAIPNTAVGVLLTSSAEKNVIGGTTAAARNIISGNGAGVSINNDGTKGNIVQGNYIGVNASGAALGNSVVGVEITSGAFGNTIGGASNASDAVTTSAANRIAFNGNSGVRVSEETTFNNTIRGNSIFGNGGLGINLEPANESPDARTANAPTPNDSGDSDSGPNHLQNFPILTTLSSASGSTTINGTLNSRPGTTYVIDFYRNSQGDSSGFGEGEIYLGSKRVTTDSTGNATFSFAATGTFSGTTISATATNLTSGETSEFSPLSLSNVVTNTNNDGLGSLRTALRVASAADNIAIRFNIPATLAAGGVFTIRPLTPLPTITRNGIILDGTTQTAFSGNTNAAGPEIVITGNAMPSGGTSPGLVINGDNCVVRSLVINGFPRGIDITGVGTNLVASGNKIEGCYIGTTATGTAATAAVNLDDGIRLADDGFTPGTGVANTIIGGTTAAARNVISNNGRYGIVMGGTATSGNLVLGNYIGTNATGTSAVPNARGIGIFGAHDNVIGGTNAAVRNLIFGNGDIGVVFISEVGTNRNKVQGNYIGLNKDGTAALVTGANVPDIFGVRITNGAQGNIVGGTESGAGNVIAGLTNGIGLTGVGTNGNLVQGNIIGLSASGTVALPNIGNGIIVSAGAQNNIIGAPRDATGARVASAGNRIAFNSNGDGIRVFAGATEQTVGNTIRGNRVFNNGGLGINLFPSSEAAATATPNDASDGDSGPNNLQNFPVISTVTTAGSNLTITGTFNSAPNKTFVLDLYRNAGDNSACGGNSEVAEGELYVASQNVTTGANGNATFTFTVSSAGGQVFTVTATNLSTGDTSEFSPTPLGSATSAVTNTRDSGTGSLRTALSAVGVCGNTVTFNIPQSDPGFNAASGTFTIQVASPLPMLLSNGILLDGTSQPGYTNRPIIMLNGSNAGAGATGLGITAANCTVKGLIISGFKGRQVSISGATATNNVIQGCYIGTDATGNAGIAGSGAGVVISNGPRNNKIGGIAAGEASRIAFNGGDGVVVGSSATDTATGNTIRGNRIYGNSGLGINLVGGSQDSRGATANDANDVDTGPNNLQNFPIITGLHISGTSAVSGTVDLTLNSKPSTSFAIDFYRVTALDPSGFGEGEFYLGSRTVTTDASGNYKGTLSFSLGGNFAEQSLSITATNLGTGDTSEFGPGQMLVGTVNTWGYNHLGQLGDGSTNNTRVPKAINLNGVVAIAAGGAHSLAVKSDGTVWSWGNNGAGQLGDGTGNNRLTPVQVPGLFDVQMVAGGWYHSLALKRDGTVWSWGRNSEGQLGDGTKLVSALPVRVSGLSGVIAITAGVYYSVALKSDGTVWCWGSNFYGQLGDGTKIDRTTPVQVKGVSGIRAIAAGAGHTVLLRNDGTVLTFGWNAGGQLGSGTTTDSLTPVTVSGVSRVGLIAAGYAHTLAVDSSGAIVSAWGSNASGQLGDGTFASRLSPVRVTSLSGVRLMAAGSSHSLAVKNDGTLWSWGNNVYGAVGDNTNTDKNIPVQTQGLGDVGAISGGFSHSMALGTRAGVVLPRSVARTAPVFDWSSVTVTMTPSSIQLGSAIVLDSSSASDSLHYNVAVNGVAVEVQSAAYSTADETVTLQLPPGAMRSGDQVTVAWWGLRDKQKQPLADGQRIVILP